MSPRATVVGSGPNGLAAAVSLARAGYAVRVLEAQSAPGGSARSAALTLPGFVHDVGSAVHPAARTSPFFRAFSLDTRVQWLVPEISFAQALPDAGAATAWRSLERTRAGLGADGPRWERIVRVLYERQDALVEITQDRLWGIPRHPRTAAALAVRAAILGTPARAAALHTPAGRALWTGVAAHATRTLPSLPAAAAGLFLAAHAHTAEGWPVPRGGAGAITTALQEDLLAHGGEVRCGVRIDDPDALEWGDPRRGDVLVLAGSPRLAANMAGMPTRLVRAVRRFRYGPGLAKLDLALDGPVPWRNDELAGAVTVHLGGADAEMVASARAVARGALSATPYVLLAQPSVIDPSRAPAGHAVVWAYLHVPAGSDLDPREVILGRLEEHAPGVRDRILAAVSTSAAELAARNPSAIGGDGLGGLLSLRQALRRPAGGAVPWRTPLPGVYLAGGASAPGPGVTGMPGWYAARTVLADAGYGTLSPDTLFPDPGPATMEP